MSYAEMFGWFIIGAVPGGVVGWLVGTLAGQLLWPNR